MKICIRSQWRGDPSGAVTDTYDYDAFGNLIHSTGTTQNNYLFAGEQFDPDLGLYYNRARYLNTSTGRFWTMDTDEGDDTDPQSLQKYLYGEATPTDDVDPSGNDTISDTLDTITFTITPAQSAHPLAFKSFDAGAFALTLDKNAKLRLRDNATGKKINKPKSERESTGYCGYYVGLALAAGGVPVMGNGATYNLILPVQGFRVVAHSDSDPGYSKKIGDVAVFDATAGVPHAHPYGHVEGYDGSNWVSDFIQRNFIPYRDASSAGASTIYRYPLVSGN